MTDSTSAQGEAAALAFIDAFNRQDHADLAATLNYPHKRLANGRFTTFESPDEFEVMSRKGKSRLQDENWHHTDIESLKVIHTGADKVHVAMTIHRCDENGDTYNSFDTLWIATLLDGHWGIQFRSSFLR